MYSFLKDLLSDKKGDVCFACFDGFHLCFIAAVLAATAVGWFYLKDRSQASRQKALTACVNAAFGLYIADFFLMPFAYGTIEIEKLPFHICTAMCVACFVSRHNQALFPFRVHFAVYGFLSNLVYLIYPAGVMWYQVQALSYRVIQTLLFHGVMAMYCFLVLLFDDYRWEPKKCYGDLAVIVGMTLWAMAGNYLYNGELGFFNWFFVIRDPFYLIPGEIAPFIMPFLNVSLFFPAAMLVRFVVRRCRR